MSTPRTYARPLLTLPELERLQVDEARRDRGSNALVQGWQSAGAGIQAGDLAEQALAAEQTGDQEQARGLLRRMRVAQAQANVYAPDTRSVGDVKDLGTAVDWAGGALGSMARSATPAVGAGLAGAAAGALVAGPGGAVAGGVRGATASLLRTLPTALVSYDQLRGDQVAQQYGDPEVMQRTADERASQASKTAALQTVPEIFLPTRAVGAMVERQVAGQAGKRVANTAIDALAEGGTEVLQQELGFQGQQALGSTQERNVMDYVDAGLAGAVGGLGVSGTSNVLGAAADQSLGPDAPPEGPRTPRTLSERAQRLVSDLQTEPVERAAARFLTPDRVLADDLQGADPETMAAAIAEHDRTAPDIAEQTVASLLQQERISERDKAQLASMQGKMADPVNRTQLGILLGKNRLKEVGAATAEAMTGFLKRTKDAVSSRFSMEGMNTAPLVDALAPLYNEEAPAAAQSWIELAAKFEGVKSAAAIKDPELAQRLETMADALEAVQGQADIRKGLEAVGLTSMINLIDELQGVPGAKSDLRRPSSFLRTMLQKRDQRVSPSMTAKQIDLLAPKFASMSAKEQDTYAEAFAISFGSKEAARSVLDHYAKTFEGTRSTFKEQTDALPELDQLTRGFERPSQAAAEVAEGGLTEGDLSNLQATYRDANPARPFFASSEKEALEAAASKGGIVAGMDEYIRRTGRSAAEAFGRVKGDLERRLKASRNRDRGWLTSELERAVASGADLRTRQELEKRLVKATVREDLPKLERQYAQMLSDAPAPEDMDPKRFDRALQRYRVVLRDGSDTRATDEDVHRFQRLLRVRQSIKPPAPPRDLSDTEARADYEERQAAYQAKVDAIDETVVTFTKTDGKTLKTSAESMAYASQVKGGDLQKFLSAVSSMLDRDDIASVDLPSTLVVLRQGEKRNRRTLAEMRGLSKVRKQLQARAENGSAKQKAFAKQALALIDETSGQSADRAQGKRGMAQTRAARAAHAAARKHARAVANNQRDAAKRAVYADARINRKEGSLGEQALPLLMDILPKLDEAEVSLEEARAEGLRGPELANLREKVADLRSEERVLTEFVREWLDKEFPMPSSQEYTSFLADDVQMEGGYDENDLRAAYLEEAIGVLQERLAAVRPPLTKREVAQLYALEGSMKTASSKEQAAVTARIGEITARFDQGSSLVDGILQELNAKKAELNELMDSSGRNPRDGSLRVKDNPGRQISAVVQAEQEELAQSLMSAELNPDSIPLMEMSFQGKIDELRKRGGVDAAETLRAYQLAMGRLRRIKGKRKGDDAVSYTVGADGKPQALPLDPGTAYGKGERDASFDGPKVAPEAVKAVAGTDVTPLRRFDPDFRHPRRPLPVRAEHVARPEQVVSVVDALVRALRGTLAGPAAQGRGEAEIASERAADMQALIKRLERLQGAAITPTTSAREVDPMSNAPRTIVDEKSGWRSEPTSLIRRVVPSTKAPEIPESDSAAINKEIARSRARLELAKSKRSADKAKNFEEKMQKRKAAALERASVLTKPKWLFHGTRAGESMLIDARGNLVLKPSKNFGGKTNGVSFTDDPASAKDYATRIKGGGPKGFTFEGAKIIRIDSAALSGVEAEAMNEWADYSGKDIVIPRGSYSVEPVARDRFFLRDSYLAAGFKEYVRDNYRGLEREAIYEDPAAAQEAYLSDIVDAADSAKDVTEAKNILRDEFGHAYPGVTQPKQNAQSSGAGPATTTKFSRQGATDPELAEWDRLVADAEKDLADEIEKRDRSRRTLTPQVQELVDQARTMPEDIFMDVIGDSLPPMVKRAVLTALSADEDVGIARSVLEAIRKDRAKHLEEYAKTPEGRRAAMRVVKQNAQSTAGQSVPTTMRELRDALLRMRGQNVRLAVNNLLSGYGKYERTVHGTLVERLITIAHAAPNKMSVLYHEALHDFFAELGKDPATLRIKQQLLAAASTGHVQKQLRELLRNEPAALAQLSDPEERLAYMFQFRMANPDMMRIGPNTDTLFGRIAAAVRKFVGMVTEMEKAEQILLALHDGRLADPSTAAQVMAQWSTLGDQFQHYAAPIKSALEKVFSANTVQLRAMNIPALNKIADLFEDNVKKTGLLTARAQSGGIWRNRLEKLLTGHTDAEIRAAMVHMQSMKDPVTDLHKKLAKFFADIREWQVQKGVQEFDGKFDPLTGAPIYNRMGLVKRYFPRVWDVDALTQNGPRFSQLLQQHMGFSRTQADNVLHQLRVGDQMLVKPHGVNRDAGFSPYAQSVIGRELKFSEAAAELFAEFQSKDFSGVMTRYIDQAVHRAEYAERFGNMGEGLDALMEQAKGEGATMHQIQRAKRLISGLDGTIHREMNPSIRQTQMALLTLQNLVLLPLAVFSQLIDPLGIAVRSGDVRDAGAAYKRVLTDIVQWASPRPDRAREMAEIIGAVQQDSVLQAMGMVHAGMYMSAGLRRVNDFMFKYNGMQGINNSFRTAAVTAAEKYILEHRNDARRMEELDLTPADIKEVKPGEIDYSTEKVQQALFRFADGAVVRPNAAHRPLWMSDPRFMLVAHLKQFAFSFQEVILKRVAHEKSYGNSGPLKILAMYAPIMIAADMAKWMLTGNLPQNWSVLHLFAHGVHRSGLLGVGTFGADAVSDVANDRSTILGFLGPTAQHLGLLASWIGGGVPVEDVIDRSVPLARHVTKFSRQGVDIHRNIYGGEPESLNAHKFPPGEEFIIPVTHDSPHKVTGTIDWEKYQLTGEGTMNEGAGFYVSTAERVHKGYKSQFSGEGTAPQMEEAINTLKKEREGIKYQLADAREALATAPAQTTRYGRSFSREDALADIAALEEASDDLFAELVAATKKLKALRAAPLTEQGSPTHEFSFRAKPEEVLSWGDFNTQSMQYMRLKDALKASGNPKVAALAERLSMVEIDIDKGHGRGSARPANGMDATHELAKILGDVGASRFLRDKAGFVAIMYPTHGKQNWYEPNYVILDGKRLTQEYVHF